MTLLGCVFSFVAGIASCILYCTLDDSQKSEDLNEPITIKE